MTKPEEKIPTKQYGRTLNRTIANKVKPFVERTYPMSKIADAMRHLGTGHAQGKIVITMG